jgi:hypothetical protein
MNVTAVDPHRVTAEVAERFSLCEGGRVHDALARRGLAGGARGRLVFVFALLAAGWLPPLILSALAGTAAGGVQLPYLADLGVWVRFFVFVPMAVVAEPFADRVLGGVLRRLHGDALVADAGLPTFAAVIKRTQALATSDTAELLIAAVAFVLPHLIAAQALDLFDGVTMWAAGSAGIHGLSPAGRWYAWVSLPLTQFLLLRWLWRLLIWWRLLWKIARLPLALVPAHPDQVGGLQFLPSAAAGFVPIFAAASAVAAAAISVRISHAGSTLAEWRVPIVGFVVLELILLVVPQLFFAPALLRVRQQALVRFAAAGAGAARAFEHSWLGPGAGSPQELLESNHPGAVADFNATYAVVRQMRPLGLSLRSLVGLALPLLLPFAPLLLHEYSARELLKAVLGMVR